ncbi:hypothetical protein GCK72_012865 [Caenorhabditis remanei]|uniref:Uncharacterized protein n=2 Tax=Caenorhabditis remanei TaxID=31234 RepID=A0A6A5GPR6_CAERE|nr:hypothetical protein GCK72_012865 [Caenorhabditis remanei]KAF1756412.1 hypothetical protein GCK72_012865 [Caenorhabditis remanei]
MQNPSQYKIPNWFLNRQKDIKDGKTRQMMAMVNKVLDWIRSLFWKEEMELTLVGLQNSGKTTFVNVIASGQFTEDMIPTVGFNMRKITKGNVTIKLWDIGGQPRFRSMWERYCRGVNAIVFMVDAADEEKLEASRNELMQLLDKPQLDAIPVLVLGNKKDLPGALDERQLIERMNLSSIQNLLMRRSSRVTMNRLLCWKNPQRDFFSKIVENQEFKKIFENTETRMTVYYSKTMVADNGIIIGEEGSAMRERMESENSNQASYTKSVYKWMCEKFEVFVEYSGAPKNADLLKTMMDPLVKQAFMWMLPRFLLKIKGAKGVIHSLSFEITYGGHELKTVINDLERLLASIENGMVVGTNDFKAGDFSVTADGMKISGHLRFPFTEHTESHKSFSRILRNGKGLYQVSVQRGNVQ